MITQPPPTNLLYSARPTIFIDETEEVGLSAGLLSMRIEENEEGLAHCELTFGNWGTIDGRVGFLYFDRALLDFGRLLSITAGDGDAQANIFHGRISAMEGRFPQQRPPKLAIFAEDALQSLRMTRRTRVFEEMSDGEIVERIASEHGLQHNVSLNGPTHRAIAQLNQSDLAFLRERVRASGGVLWLEDQTLFAAPLTERDAGTVSLTYGQRLLEFTALADLAQQRTAVYAHGWDEQAKTSLSAKGRTTALSAEIGSGSSGFDILENAFGTYEEHLVHHAATTQAAVDALADAAAVRTALRFVRGRGVCEGDGRIRVGTTLELNEIGTLFEGTYTVVEVRHTFDGVDGYRTTFVVERPAIGA